MWLILRLIFCKEDMMLYWLDGYEVEDLAR
jgi:hypothetical protein